MCQSTIVSALVATSLLLNLHYPLFGRPLLEGLLTSRPVLAVGFGGFVSAPGGLAAKLCRVPLVIHEQNAAPGLTNRTPLPQARGDVEEPAAWGSRPRQERLPQFEWYTPCTPG